MRLRGLTKTAPATPVKKIQVGWASAGRAARPPGLGAFEGLPILARRAEDVESHRSLRPGHRRVPHTARDDVSVARLELSRLTADGEGEGALDDEAGLLVGMAVLGHLHVRLELHQRERDA